ncbi:MAG: flagellar motor protein MotB, partial [Vibrio sp.]
MARSNSSRQKRAEPPENHERWLISYADFMTLLFALFVVLYAVASTKKDTSEQIIQQIQSSLIATGLIASNSNNPIFQGGVGITGSNKTHDLAQVVLQPISLPKESLDGEADNAEQKALANLVSTLKTTFKQEITDKAIQIDSGGEQVKISIANAVLFAESSSFVQPKYDPILDKIARLIENVPGAISITSFSSEKTQELSELYHSVWELSALRAASATKEMLDNSQLDPQRITVQGKVTTALQHQVLEIVLTQG